MQLFSFKLLFNDTIADSSSGSFVPGYPRKARKVLQVSQHPMKNVASEMRWQNVSGTVKNMVGTKRQSVRKKETQTQALS